MGNEELEKRIASLEKELSETKEKLKEYEEDKSAKFYKSLVLAIEHIEVELKNKTLDLEEDTFAKSVLQLSDKSPKIFEGLRIGRESFMVEKEDNVKKKASIKADKDGGRVGF